MIPAPDRQQAVSLIDHAVESGASKYRACEEMGISIRTYQRWVSGGKIKPDGRSIARRPPPLNKLTEQERQEIIRVANSPEYKSLPPSQIVPALADKQKYIASESSFYRVLRAANQQHARGRSRACNRKVVVTHKAVGPNELWAWDITWCPGPAKGIYFYLYLILDVYSRKVVGWEVHHEESAEHSGRLVRKAHMREQVGVKPLVLHSDNGSPMKGSSLLETLNSLGVMNSYSRPRVSNDNAYAESIFRTFKYRPDYPYKGFADIDQARGWVMKFVHWYNPQHKHSGIKFVTPAQRHSGEAENVVRQRKQVYEDAKARNPQRWSGETRNWKLPTAVYLNPEKEEDNLKQAS